MPNPILALDHLVGNILQSIAAGCSDKKEVQAPAVDPFRRRTSAQSSTTRQSLSKQRRTFGTSPSTYSPKRNTINYIMLVAN